MNSFFGTDSYLEIENPKYCNSFHDQPVPDGPLLLPQVQERAQIQQFVCIKDPNVLGVSRLPNTCRRFCRKTPSWLWQRTPGNEREGTIRREQSVNWGG